MRVALIDLLTMTPYYDYYLTNALSTVVEDLTLYAITFHLVPDFFSSLRCGRSPGACDIVAKLGLGNTAVRRGCKSLEYLLNWSCLLVRFLRRPPHVAHVQWLPLLAKTSFELKLLNWIRKLGIPIVYTVHNLMPHDLHDGKTVRARYAKLYRFVDALIVHTAHDQRRLVRQLGVSASRVFQIKQGPVLHDLPGEPRSKQEARQVLGWEDASFTFILLGVVRPYKGVENALRALPDVIEKVPEVRLVIAGQGDPAYLQYLRSLAESLGIGQHVVWELGYIPVSKVPVFYKASDVALFPYRSISQSGAALTAAGLGSCILASGVGGLAEIITDDKTGVLWSSKNTGDLAERMVYCAQLPIEERRRLGEAVRFLVLTEHSWDTIAVQTRKVYEFAIQQRKGQ